MGKFTDDVLSKLRILDDQSQIEEARALREKYFSGRPREERVQIMGKLLKLFGIEEGHRTDYAMHLITEMLVASEQQLYARQNGLVDGAKISFDGQEGVITGTLPYSGLVKVRVNVGGKMASKNVRPTNLKLIVEA